MMRSWKRWPAVVGAALACVAVAAPATAGAAQGGTTKRFPFPDTSLGGTGAVDLTPLLSTPALAGREISYAPTPSGAVWLGTSRRNCAIGASYECGTSSYLSRLNSKGELVTSLGESGSLGYLGTGRGKSAIVSDAEGRAVTVSIDGAGLVTVRRFLPTGVLDTSFGSGGVSSFSCGCQSDSEPVLSVSIDGRGRILAGVAVTGFGAPPFGMRVTARLLSDGSLDHGFGTGGFLRTGQSENTYLSANGAVINFLPISQSGGLPTIERYSPQGVLDTGFDTRANQALAKVGRENRWAFALRVVGLRFRGHGMIDVILSSYDSSEVLRLRSNGDAETKFGKAGVKAVPQVVGQMLPESEGATLAFATQALGEVALIRYLRDYKLDPSFGTKGSLALVGVESGEGFSMTPASNGRVTIVDEGRRFCRWSYCPPQPKLLRYRVGKAK